METSELYVRLDMMWPSKYSSGKAGKYTRHGMLDLTVCPFGKSPWVGDLLFVDRKCGASTLKKIHVAPVSGIIVLLSFYGI